MFKLKSIQRVNEVSVKVCVEMDAGEWTKAKRDNALGQLYGIDISNEVYHLTGVKAYEPSVNDRNRSKDGIKLIELYYQDTVWQPAPDNVIIVDFVARRRAA